MKTITFLLFIVLTGTVSAQKRPEHTDRVGNFIFDGRALEWQKNYEVEDLDKLNEKLGQEPFTQGIEIMQNDGSKQVKGFRLSGENLPAYAREPYDAFVVIDVFYDRIRVSVKQIVFPDFKENHYYNGMRVNDSRGSLEHYVVSNGKIKRTTGALNVLYSFDTAFSTIFDRMLRPISE